MEQLIEIFAEKALQEEQIETRGDWEKIKFSFEHSRTFKIHVSIVD